MIDSCSLMMSVFQGQLLNYTYGKTGKSVHPLSTSLQIQRIINPPAIPSPIIQPLGQLCLSFQIF